MACECAVYPRTSVCAIDWLAMRLGGLTRFDHCTARWALRPLDHRSLRYTYSPSSHLLSTTDGTAINPLRSTVIASSHGARPPPRANCNGRPPRRGTNCDEAATGLGALARGLVRLGTAWDER